MHRACTRLRQRNPNLFIVESLFANNEQGVWYDPSDMNTLFQDDAGTIPVTASGQTVGRILDKSGRGNHATQSTAGSRPTFRDVGGLRFLEFDGVNDFLVTSNINFTATDKMSLFAGVRKLSDGTAGAACELSADINVNNGTFAMFLPRNVGSPDATFRSKGTIVTDALVSGNAAPISLVFTGTGDISGDMTRARTNGGAFVTNTGDQGAGNYGNHPLFIGRRGGILLPFTGHIYGLVIRGASSDETTVLATERYLAAKTGVTLA